MMVLPLINRAAPDLIWGLWRRETPDQVRGCDGVGLFGEGTK